MNRIINLTFLRLTVLLLSLSVNQISFAQSKSVIVRSYAFYVESVRGNFPEYAGEEIFGGRADTVRELARRVDTSIVIYMETRSKQITWDTARQKGRSYFITALLLNPGPFQAGTAKGGSTVIIRPAKGNFLWQLQLSPAMSSKNQPGKITRHEIILKGKYRGKNFTWKTGSLKDLIPIPSV